MDLNQLIEEILRLRKICRSRPGAELSFIHQEILEQARQQLLDDLTQNSKLCQQLSGDPTQDSKLRPNKQTSKDEQQRQEQCKSTFKKVLNDATLTKLAIAAKQTEPGSPQRRHALGELIEAIELSGQIRFSTEIEKEVKQALFVELCKNIAQFDPGRGTLMAWVNDRRKWLEKRVQEKNEEPFTQSSKAKFIREKTKLKALLKGIQVEQFRYWIGLKVKGGNPEVWIETEIVEVFVKSLLVGQLPDNELSDFLNKILKEIMYTQLQVTERYGNPNEVEHRKSPEEAELLSEKIREYLQDDPEQRLQSYVRGHPEVTFQAIALDYLDQVSWKEMSEKYNVPIPTLSTFYQRELKKLKKAIREYIQNHD